MKITATTHNEFLVEVDGSTQRCFLGGNVLRSVPCKKGEIALSPAIRVVLGTTSFEAVTKLKVGQVFEGGAQ